MAPAMSSDAIVTAGVSFAPLKPRPKKTSGGRPMARTLFAVK